MAIFSIQNSSVGRTTHAPGTAGAHVSYISRSGACSAILAKHMPKPKPGSKGGPARRWLDEQEQDDRKNARVIDKIMIAFPLELDQSKQLELINAFLRSAFPTCCARQLPAVIIFSGF